MPIASNDSGDGSEVPAGKCFRITITRSGVMGVESKIDGRSATHG